MIQGVLNLVPFFLVSVGYPMSVYYKFPNFETTFFIAFGFMIISFSLMLTFLLPNSKPLSDRGSLPYVALDPDPIFKKRVIRAEEMFSSGVDPKDYVEKRFETPMIPPKAPLVPPRSPQNLEKRYQNLEKRYQNLEKRHQNNPIFDKMKLETYDLEAENVIIPQDKPIIPTKTDTPPLPMERKSLKDLDLEDLFGYCWTCRKVVPVINAEVELTKNNKRIFKSSNCQYCGYKVKGFVVIK